MHFHEEREEKKIEAETLQETMTHSLFINYNILHVSDSLVRSILFYIADKLLTLDKKCEH